MKVSETSIHRAHGFGAYTCLGYRLTTHLCNLATPSYSLYQRHAVMASALLGLIMKVSETSIHRAHGFGAYTCLGYRLATHLCNLATPSYSLYQRHAVMAGATITKITYNVRTTFK